MLTAYDEFVRRADSLRARIDAACAAAGRDPAGIEILAVTKTHPVEAVEFVARYGLRAVGENRVQEAATKRSQCNVPISWELIGHLQSNKARLAVDTFDRIQSVDSSRLLELLDRTAAAAGRVLPVLLQINAGRDDAKFGASIEDAPRLLDDALTKTSLRVDGLMTIAPLSDDPDVAARAFAALRDLRDYLATSRGVALRDLSMGMTGDLEPAVAAGSTIVRVGTALFGDRQNQ